MAGIYRMGQECQSAGCLRDSGEPATCNATQKTVRRPRSAARAWHLCQRSLTWNAKDRSVLPTSATNRACDRRSKELCAQDGVRLSLGPEMPRLQYCDGGMTGGRPPV